jgi:uncharacterized protein YkwD
VKNRSSTLVLLLILALSAAQIACAQKKKGEDPKPAPAAAPAAKTTDDTTTAKTTETKSAAKASLGTPQKPPADASGETAAPPPEQDFTGTTSFRLFQPRSAAEVCERWRSDYPATATSSFSRGSSDCDAGAIAPAAHEDAIRRLNLYRWLAGQSPVTVSDANARLAQSAALMMNANQALNHAPPTSWKCHSREGAQAAGSSNLALGIRTAAEAIDLYVADNGVDSLGHRRWALHPDLGEVGIGHYGTGNAMWVFGRQSGALQPEFVTYPATGVVPAASVFSTKWSFARKQLGQGRLSVRVAKVGASGPENWKSASSSRTPDGFGYDTIAFDFPFASQPAFGQALRASGEYQVEVKIGRCTYGYKVALVNCANAPATDGDPTVHLTCAD